MMVSVLRSTDLRAVSRKYAFPSTSDRFILGRAFVVSAHIEASMVREKLYIRLHWKG